MCGVATSEVLSIMKFFSGRWDRMAYISCAIGVSTRSTVKLVRLINYHYGYYIIIVISVIRDIRVNSFGASDGIRISEHS